MAFIQLQVCVPTLYTYNADTKKIKLFTLKVERNKKKQCDTKRTRIFDTFRLSVFMHRRISTLASNLALKLQRLLFHN